MSMVNPDDYLEIAAAKYADLIIRALDPDLGRKSPRREPAPGGAWPIRLTAAALLRRLADAIQAEPEVSHPIAVAR